MLFFFLLQPFTSGKNYPVSVMRFEAIIIFKQQKGIMEELITNIIFLLGFRKFTAPL